MRIISHFKDYYDCMQATDEDRDLLYIRKQEVIKLEKRNPYDLDRVIVGFCGNIYYGARLSKYLYTYPNRMETSKWFFKYDGKIEQWVNNYYSKKELEEFYKSKYFWTQNKDIDTKFILNKWFSGSVEDIFYKKYFEQYNSPIFTIQGLESESKLTVNAQLSLYNFQSFKDVHETYQELSIYMNNLGSPMKPIPEISNEDMIESKGFDLKNSFRKSKKDK